MVGGCCVKCRNRLVGALDFKYTPNLTSQNRETKYVRNSADNDA